MRNSLKIFAGVMIFAVVGLTYVWPYIEMNFAGSAHYTEQDKREYEFYTPDILRNMPRVSAHYEFDYANITGPASHVFAVTFHASEETKRIEDYLASAGYKPTNCHFDRMCWRGSDPEEAIYVNAYHDDKIVTVQVVYNFI